MADGFAPKRTYGRKYYRGKTYRLESRFIGVIHLLIYCCVMGKLGRRYVCYYSHAQRKYLHGSCKVLVL